ncbi:SIS domain-containing protein [Neotabrizicola sp. sgz301269]|uniref:SIS domain-containing protein n=1 Tax=Neotabrizicola sp. sgz301269 TaxID=3276282 RepID=UPI00376F8C13
MSLAERAAGAAQEMHAAVAAINPEEWEAILAALQGARRIVCHGLGREGLMMRAFAMRLYHLGLDAHVLGEMTCPPVGEGDLFLVACGPGTLASAEALIGVARGVDAGVACITAEPGGPAPHAADLVLTIPAQTMARDQDGAATSLLPMGSLFEGAMFLAFELMILELRARLEVTPEAMRFRHTNLE